MINVKNIFNQFIKNDSVVSCEKYGNGHINITYLLKTSSGRTYILQKINTNIFKDVDMLMNNIGAVTEFLRLKNKETINLFKTVDGKLYAKQNNSFFRMYEFINKTTTFEKAENLEMVKNAAIAYGKFHEDLSAFDGSLLGEVIPHFHDTKKRYNDFLLSLDKDSCKRAKNCISEIENIKKYADLYSKIVDSIETKEIPLHVTHNDPKINNALFDINSHKFRAVIDLDTIMPGSVLYDFGDALRSLFTGDKEDSKDYKNVLINFDIYEAYLDGYYKQAKPFLTSKEIELLPFAPFLMTIECGMRFLADYLDGDIYFHVDKEEHNLDRARTQINLANSIINNIEKLKGITMEVIKRYDN